MQSNAAIIGIESFTEAACIFQFPSLSETDAGDNPQSNTKELSELRLGFALLLKFHKVLMQLLNLFLKF